jgi:hypothetical protein
MHASRLMQGFGAALESSNPRLACYQSSSSAWAELPTQFIVAEAASDDGPDASVVSVAQAPAAEAWKLSWMATASDASPHDVLRSMYINPTSGASCGGSEAAATSVVAAAGPLAAKLAIAMVADAGSVALLAPTHCAVSGQRAGAVQVPTLMLDTIAELSMSELKLAVHRHHAGGALSVDIALKAGVRYVDSTMLVLSSLVEPSQMRFCYESATLSGAPPLSGGDARLDDAAFWRNGFDVDDVAALAIRCPPARHGTSYSVDVPDALTVNFFELTPHELQRLAHLATMAADSAPPPGMLLVNSAQTPVLVRQAGTNHEILLAAGQSKQFCWSAPPSAGGAQCALQLARHGAEDNAAVAWSEPVELRRCCPALPLRSTHVLAPFSPLQTSCR